MENELQKEQEWKQSSGIPKVVAQRKETEGNNF